MKPNWILRSKTSIYSCSSGFSALFIVISCLVVMVTIFAGIIMVNHIRYNYTPSAKTIERLIGKGKLDEAHAMVYKTKLTTAGVDILKAKVHIALSLKEHSDNHWQTFGVNPEDWLDDDNSRVAVDLLKDAIALDPSSAVAHCLLGVVLKEMGKLDEAEENLLSARNLDPSSVDSYLALSSLYALQSRYNDAENVLRSASTLHPENPYIMKNLGFLYRFHIQKPESSIVWLNRFLSNADPNDNDIGVAKAEFRELIQRYPEVVQVDTTVWGIKRNFIAREKSPFK